MKQIVADEGLWLTQASVGDGTDRVFSKQVFMPDGASEEAWTQWTDAQKTEWEAAREAEMLALLENNGDGSDDVAHEE